MLAQPAEDAEDALARLGEAAFEWKLDGARIQVHKIGDEVRVFTRKLNEVTAAVPEIVEVTRGLPVPELILDGEAIALRADGRPQPFQVTMRRFGRKLDVEAMRAQLPLRCFFFDALALERRDADRPARARAGRSARCRAAGRATDSADRHEPSSRSRKNSSKARSSRATRGRWPRRSMRPTRPAGGGRAGSRSSRRTRSTSSILAAEWGHGRRRGLLSNLHLGAYDPAANGCVMLGKTFKGLTDQMLAWQTERLLGLESGRDDYTVHVRPELVVEIAFNDLQASPHYPGGLALRFARVKAYRAGQAGGGGRHDRDRAGAVRAPGRSG